MIHTWNEELRPTMLRPQLGSSRLRRVSLTRLSYDWRPAQHQTLRGLTTATRTPLPEKLCHESSQAGISGLRNALMDTWKRPCFSSEATPVYEIASASI